MGKTVNGVIWSAIERFSVQIVQFVVSVILARILTPSDFGLVAIVYVFTNIFQTINESGFNTALIHKLNRDNTDYSTVFFANIFIGLVSYLIIFLFSGLIADFYQMPELKTVMRLIGIIVFVNSFIVVQNARFTINIDFKTQAKATLFAAIVSGIFSIFFAYKYKNVYALAVQSITFSLTTVILMWIYGKWRPSLEFSFSRFRGLFQYAYKLILSRLISVLYDDLYSLIVGKFFSSSILGYYNRAMSLMQISSRNIVGVVQRVSIPILCQKQSSKDEMSKVLLRFLVSTAAIVYPVLACLMVLRKPLIEFILTDKWLPSADILLYVCPIGFMYLISTFNRNVYNATGRTDLALKVEIIKKTIFIAIFLFSLKYGFKAVLLSQILNSFIEMLFDTYFVKRQIGLTLFTQLRSLLAVILVTLFMAVVISFFIMYVGNSSVVKLVGGFAIGILSYLLMCYCFNVAEFKTKISVLISRRNVRV